MFEFDVVAVVQVWPAIGQVTDSSVVACASALCVGPGRPEQGAHLNTFPICRYWVLVRQPKSHALKTAEASTLYAMTAGVID